MLVIATCSGIDIARILSISIGDPGDVRAERTRWTKPVSACPKRRSGPERRWRQVDTTQFRTSTRSSKAAIRRRDHDHVQAADVSNPQKITIAIGA
jgi:hypothetical protein